MRPFFSTKMHKIQGVGEQLPHTPAFQGTILEVI